MCERRSLEVVTQATMRTGLKVRPRLSEVQHSEARSILLEFSAATAAVVLTLASGQLKPAATATSSSLGSGYLIRLRGVAGRRFAEFEDHRAKADLVTVV